MIKQLVMLIGSQGSGKSTYAATVARFTYINQDKQGKDGHFKLFTEAVESGKNIVVDRINHTRQQRMKYVSLAREAGYHVVFKIFSEKYKTCLDRILNREGHETLKKGDLVSARNALDMFFNQFEYPRQDEYDELVRPNFIHGHSYILNDKSKKIIVGDLHGCYDEFLDLLIAAKYNPHNDTIISLGDLNDRGPKSNDCIRRFNHSLYERHYGIRGNHDDKFIRWLRGNKVNTESIQKTIDQFGEDLDKDQLYYKMMDMPYIIKVGENNFCTHAGFNPEYDPMCNSKEFSMYARYYDPQIRTFSNAPDLKYWFEYLKPSENNYFFGHIVFDKMPKNKGVYALDAGCYAGGKLRAAVLRFNKFSEIIEVDSQQPKSEPEKDWDYMNKFEPYDKLVDAGYLNKKESGDLVLYNYTEKTTYDKMWNKYTMECRGLILNKVTGETVARPFPKFFNLSELENKELGSIPVGESYKVYDKADGSLGILYQDTDGSYKIATRGSFESDQAKIAKEMLNNTVKTFPLEVRDYTLCFEIIYPENRFNDGARLVCDYGDTKTLILLAAINKTSGKSLSYQKLVDMAQIMNLPVVKQFDYTIEQLVEMKKTLSVTQEGWVVQFESGFRVKIKGNEYCKLQKILNSISPISIWEKMQDDEEFKLTDQYKSLIPEEILPEVNELESKLKAKYVHIAQEVTQFVGTFKNLHPLAVVKDLALVLQNTRVDNSGMYFSAWNNDYRKMSKQIIKIIRPKANEL